VAKLVLSVPVFAVVLIAALTAAVLLRRTPAFWVAGLLLNTYGIAVYFAWPWFEPREGTGLQGLTNARHIGAAAILVIAGFALVVLGARSRNRATQAMAENGSGTSSPSAGSSGGIRNRSR